MTPSSSCETPSAPSVAAVRVGAGAAQSSNHSEKARLRALAAMLASALLFAVMGASAKWATRMAHGLPTIPAPELAVFRYACGLALLGALRWSRGVDLLGSDRRGLLWRGVYGGLASTCFFYGLELTSLTNATLLNYTFVIWALLMAVFALGERLGTRGVFAVCAALVGVAQVTRPEVGHIRVGDLIALFSGVMAGAAVVQIRRLRQGESAYAVFFYFNLIGVPISLATAPFSPTPFVVPALAQVPLLLVIGLTSFGGQLLMTYGYRELTAAQGSLITLTTVLYAAVLAWLFFHDPLTPQTLFGGLLILVSAAVMALSTKKSLPLEE
ncbi:MAG TPA: DMT family transporter [Chthonomonadaceae bacterium]|nr:DMT family transporter [Chthonomonadaceae bacterium]